MIPRHAVTQIVHALVHYAIASEVAKGPATAGEIAARCNIDPVEADRLLWACASLGLVLPDRHLRFGRSPMLDMLRRDTPGSVRGLATTVAALSAQFSEHCKRSPEQIPELYAAVSDVTATVSKEVAEIVDTHPFQVAADIGGDGELVHALMEENPRLKGIVFDRPERVATTSLASRWHGMRARLSVVGGDALSCVPRADLYLLKYILNDREAGACVQILNNCRRLLPADGRVVVLELQLEERQQRGLTAVPYPPVVVAPPGRERSLPEYEELYFAAGLRLVEARPTRSGVVVMQAVLE
jgi:O-methyltransferase domain